MIEEDEELEGSITKWKRMVRSTKAKDRGTANCPLCLRYYQLGCRGCVVYISTKVTGCCRTPFAKWSDHHNVMHGGYNRLAKGSSRIPHCKECLKLAREEEAFLESLRGI